MKKVGTIRDGVNAKIDLLQDAASDKRKDMYYLRQWVYIEGAGASVVTQIGLSAAEALTLANLVQVDQERL